MVCVDLRTAIISLYNINWTVFRRDGKNCEKQLLASSCPSVRLSAWNSASTGGIFMKFDIWVFFEYMSRKFMFHYNLARITVLYMQTEIHFRSHLAQFFLEWKMFQTKVVEKLETHFMSNNFSRKSCRLWDNVEKCCRMR